MTRLSDQRHPAARTGLVGIFLILCVTAGVRCTLAADWKTFRADQARSGYTSEAFPNQLTLRWVHRAQHAPRPAWSSSQRMNFDQAFQPIIMGDTVVFGSSADDRVVAIDADTGHVLWTFVTEGPVRFAPAGRQNRVFVASDDGWLYALSLDKGRLLWKHRGGPNDQKILGNQRVISHWPARGGPIVSDDTVYFAAGIWPSDGVFLHALDAETGDVKWTNDRTGGLEMAQPHGGARAESGVSAQGYLLASDTNLFVPTGRAVPAAFDRRDGKLLYYHLQKNSQRGGSRAVLADQFLLNSGCLFDQQSGDLTSQMGLGPAVATPGGIMRAEGKSLAEYRWTDAQRKDRRGQSVPARTLQKVRLVDCEREVLEFIVTGSDAICGEDGRVCAIDYSRQRNTWWSHSVEGRALGLAYGNGRLVVTTDRGLVYCFDGERDAGGRTRELLTDSGESNVSKVNPNDSNSATAAEEIINRTGITEGFCVDLACGNGELALQLAKRTGLQIYAVESDAEQVAIARRRLAEAGVYGSQVTVFHADPAKSFLPERFANLVVSTRSLTAETAPEIAKELHRLQRPYGGTVCIGQTGDMDVNVRGELEGAGSWTHQNANAANTICSMDQLVKGPLEMFWFRDIDFELPNRHGQAPAPLFHNGILIAGGVDGLCALDAYNGRKLWTFELKGNLQDYDGIHHDVGVGETGSNFCVGGDSVYVKSGESCHRIDLATGTELARFKTPVTGDAQNRNWSYLAVSNGLLFGGVANEEHTVSPRYQLSKLYTESTSLFALDAVSGELKWQFQPQHSIRNNAITIGASNVFLVDRPLVMADRVTNPRRDGRHGKLIKPSEQPAGTLVSLNTSTGDVKWKLSDNIFATQLAVSEDHNVVLMNFQAVRHNFFKLPSEIGGRIAAVDASTGEKLWDVKADYETRPLINDNIVYAQGGAWDLKTGKPVPFALNRSYGCGQISASANLLLFRSGTLGYLDLSREAGTENFGGIRTSCWINAIPAGGLVLVPDGSTKCRCSYQMQAWFALQPRK
jgi:outer membrane protein assembly factor BamB